MRTAFNKKEFLKDVVKGVLDGIPVDEKIEFFYPHEWALRRGQLDGFKWLVKKYPTLITPLLDTHVLSFCSVCAEDDECLRYLQSNVEFKIDFTSQIANRTFLDAVRYKNHAALKFIISESDPEVDVQLQDNKAIRSAKSNDDHRSIFYLCAYGVPVNSDILDIYEVGSSAHEGLRKLQAYQQKLMHAGILIRQAGYYIKHRTIRHVLDADIDGSLELFNKLRATAVLKTSKTKRITKL